MKWLLLAIVCHGDVCREQVVARYTTQSVCLAAAEARGWARCVHTGNRAVPR